MVLCQAAACSGAVVPCKRAHPRAAATPAGAAFHPRQAPPAERPHALAHGRRHRAAAATTATQRPPLAPPPAAVGRFEDPASAAGSVIVEVLADEPAVAARLCDAVESAAAAAIAARGTFTLAIPGGSVLKALKGLSARSSIPWDRVRIFFVNHKTVPNEDAATSSYAKARALFLDAVGAPPGCVATLTGSDDAEAEAAAYQAALQGAAEEAGMERAPSGAPRFDLMLLGVGSDGHVGSLYPGGKATDASGAWVLPVAKSKPPASITLSLSVMNAARSVVVCLTGAKKAAAAKLALEAPVPPGVFPAQMVQPDLAPAVWLLDEAAAAELALVQGSSASSGSGADATDAGGTAAAGTDGAAGSAASACHDPQAGQLLPDGSILYTF